MNAKYLLSRAGFTMYRDQAMEGRCPRFLGLGLFVLWALEMLEAAPNVHTLKLTCVVTSQLGSKVPLSLRIAHHGVVAFDNTSRTLGDDEMMMLPYAMLGHGSHTLSREDPLVAQALATQDDTEFDELVIRIAHRMDASFDEPSIVHDIGLL